MVTRPTGFSFVSAHLLLVILLAPLCLLSSCHDDGGGTSTVTTPPVVGPDPLYADQWHLANTGQGGGTAGEDINIDTLFDDGVKGAGVVVAIPDEGVEIRHEDLSANVVRSLCYNYATGTTDPTAGAHGTSVAGLIAARDENDLGGRGVAPRASIAAYMLLQNDAIDEVDAADAMTRNLGVVSVNSNSWGPTDGLGTLDPAPTPWKAAIETGLADGRDGKGVVYVWAAGNGYPRDNSNYDGYANHHGVIAVAAVDHDGFSPYYSEPGANLLVSAPGGGYNCGTDMITTTDRTAALGYNSGGSAGDYADGNYTSCFNGTSAATPIVAGVVALMLGANPDLGWRDVREIVAVTARKNDPLDADWVNNGAGLHVNHDYGFGVVDAKAAVDAALSWTPVGSELTFTGSLISPNLSVPDDGTPVSSHFTVAASGISHIEHVEVTFTATHGYSGDLDVRLTSPSGTVSRLAEEHICDGDVCDGYTGWVFGSARNLGEAADGTWTLTVADGASGDIGTFNSWSLKIRGR